MITNIT
ncbi:hypothetical protein YPPY93_3559, partial [Yersinia pestis PY-93]